MIDLVTQFSEPLLQWYEQEGRKDLPWQDPRTAYRVWVSEIMLQQTQVKTVIPYFNRFVNRFSDVWQLAAADEDELLSYWSGLGYYSRARNLYKTAKIICQLYQGEFPSDLVSLQALPGIGPSTAAAIASQAFNLPTPILDGNVKRVLCRYFLVGGVPEQSLVKEQLWQLANKCMPTERCTDYTQAIMDLGALCCTAKKPNCSICPLQKTCLAYLNEKTEEYPEKKLKNPLPTKEQQFLLLYDNEDKVYLEKRPPVGIWGGLWCLPSIDSNQCPINYIATTYQLNCLKLELLTRKRHSFSHFHLDITAYALGILDNNKSAVRECPGRWVKATEIGNLGLAKPVSDIINYFMHS